MSTGLHFPFRFDTDLSRADHATRALRSLRNIDDFRRHVLTDPPLQKALQAVEHQGQFEYSVHQAGRDLGFVFDDADIKAAFRSGPLRAADQDPGPTAGWTPARIFFRDHRPMAEWVWTGARRFTEPFFEGSMKVALRRPFARFFRREHPLKIEFGGGTLAPSGFILHMSRCGSTLISQMLAASPRHVTISEAPPLDEMIQAKRAMPDLPEEEHIRWLRQIVQALGQRRTGAECRYFIKMDAWHIHNLSLIRAAFPGTPWIFVYRDPLEVMVSQLARPGLPGLPGAIDPGILGLEPTDVTRLSREEWCAAVLAGILRAALAARDDPHGIFVHYRSLPEAVFGPVARHFGLSLSDDDVVRMRTASSFDAKNSGLEFQADSDHKQAQATTGVRALCGSLLSPIYRELTECLPSPTR